MATSERGTCPVCNREIAVNAAGELRPHTRRINHNPDAAPDDQVIVTLSCRGSRREAAEHKGRKVAAIRAKAEQRRNAAARR